ncbi:MAG: hypothetical protein ACJA0N_000633 [Pseudohongiellaceae bacterium]|jgi:hypothetical protein
MTDTDISANHTSGYILNREYFSECFDESANTTTSVKTYRQAILLIIIAGVFFAMKVEAYVAWFLLCLSGIELLSIKYKRGWWIARQMLSRSTGSTVNIRVNDQGIFTDSTYHQQGILWNDIAEIKSTEKGFVIVHNSGTTYLSRSGIDKNILALLAHKAL